LQGLHLLSVGTAGLASPLAPRIRSYTKHSQSESRDGRIELRSPCGDPLHDIVVEENRSFEHEMLSAIGPGETIEESLHPVARKKECSSSPRVIARLNSRWRTEAARFVGGLEGIPDPPRQSFVIRLITRRFPASLRGKEG